MGIQCWSSQRSERGRVQSCGPWFVSCPRRLPRLSRAMTSAPFTPCIHEALPEEVLGVIFEEHAKLEWKAPVIDGQVCRQWQRTILRSPRAWAQLDIAKFSKPPPSKLRQWLDRSGSVPLHIKVTMWIQGVEELLDQHHKRIKSIEIVCYFRLLEHRSFPILQSLNITGQGSQISVIRCHAMPELRSLRVYLTLVDSLPWNAVPPLRDLVLYKVKDCDNIIRNSFRSLTSLMLSCVSFQYTSETLEFPSLRFLSLYEVTNVKHWMNVPALTTYHESGRVEKESFSMPLPFLVEYGFYGYPLSAPPNVTSLHRHYPNISRLSFRTSLGDAKRFCRSLCEQPTALPMLRIFAVGNIFLYTVYSREDEHIMRNDVFERNMASSVKMELCFDGNRVPLYFGNVSVYINESRSEPTSTLSARITPIEDCSFVLGLLIPWINVSTYIVSLASTSFSCMSMYY